MITLGVNIATGSERRVYIHPKDPSAVIKILRKRAAVDRNAVDFRCLERTDCAVRSVLPKFVGWVETDHGRGAVYQAIRDCNGSISRPIIEAFKRKHISKNEGIKLIVEFFDAVIPSNLPMHDVNFHNLLIQEVNGKKKLVLVDGFGPQREDLKAYLRSKFRILDLSPANSSRFW